MKLMWAPFKAWCTASLLAVAAQSNCVAEEIICNELANDDIARAVISINARNNDIDTNIDTLELVTPEFLWSAPGQAETQRFAAEKSDVSPNLVDIPQVHVNSVFDAAGMLRVIDFNVSEPMAVELEGLRGSLVFHEAFVNRRALGSLFYAASGNISTVVPVRCVKFR